MCEESSIKEGLYFALYYVENMKRYFPTTIELCKIIFEQRIHITICTCYVVYAYFFNVILALGFPFTLKIFRVCFIININVSTKGSMKIFYIRALCMPNVNNNFKRIPQ